MAVTDPGFNPNLTLWDVYQAVLSLDRRVLSLEVAVKAAVETKADQETRLRSMERWAYAIPPAILGSIASVALAVIR